LWFEKRKKGRIKKSSFDDWGFKVFEGVEFFCHLRVIIGWRNYMGKGTFEIKVWGINYYLKL